MEENEPQQMTPDMAPETTFPPEPVPTASLDAIPQIQDTTVPVTPLAQPIAPQSPEVPPRKKPARLVAGIIAVAAIVLLGGGGVLAYTQWYQNPDKVVHDAIIKAVQAKSLVTTGDISYKTEGADIKLTLDSKSRNPNGEVNAKATVALDTESFKHTFNASGSVRIIGDTAYVRLSGIQKIVDDMAKDSKDSVPSYVSDLVKKVDEKWLSIKPSDYEDVSKEASDQQKCFTKLVEKIQSDKAMMDEVTNLYKAHQFIVVKEKLGTKDVDGVGSLGYRVEADKDAVTRFVKGLEGTVFGKEIKACNKDMNFGDFANDITKEETGTDKTEGKIELWVSRFGHDITEVIANGKDNTTTLDVVLRPLFNKDVSVEAPKDTSPLKDLVKDFQDASTKYYMDTYNGEESSLSEDMARELSAFQAA